jgi:hypothetical protein
MNTRGVTDEWTMALRCPDCALVGVARLSKANRAASKVDHLPEGFKSVVSDHGNTFNAADRAPKLDFSPAIPSDFPVFPGRLPNLQNRPRLDSKTEFNGVGGLRTYIRNCVGVVSIGIDL